MVIDTVVIKKGELGGRGGRQRLKDKRFRPQPRNRRSIVYRITLIEQ